MASGIAWGVWIGPRIVVAGDPAATVAAVGANEVRYRLGVVLQIAMAMNLVALASALDRLLAGVGGTLAAAARRLVLVAAFLGAAMALAGFVAFHVLGGRPQPQAGGADPIGELVGRFLCVRIAGYTVSGLFLHLGLAGGCLMLARARVLPRTLGVLGVLAFGLSLVAEVASLVLPGSPPDLMTSFGPFETACIVPGILFELAAGAWLLARRGEG